MVTRSKTLPPAPGADTAADLRPIAIPGATGVTLAEFAGMRDVGPPTELVRGEVVEVPRPAQHHGLYCSNVVIRLGMWNPGMSRGNIYSNDTGVVLEDDPGTLRGPDVMFISKARIEAAGEIDLSDWLRTPPELAVEVKSPSESWPETGRKAVEYLTAGVAEVWVLDGPTRQLRVHRETDGEPLTLREADELTSPHLPGFACKVSDLLAVG